MVSFNTLVVCVGALASICSAHGGYPHMHHRRSHLQGRAGYNGTETTVLPVIGTAVVSPPAEYTSTVIQTNTKFVTLSYTLGNGAVKTTTITKAEETVKTIAHVKSTVIVAPIIESTATSAFLPVAPLIPSEMPKSTSTTTLVVTVDGPETATVSIIPETATGSATSACSVQTIYVPQYITLYSTVTFTATPSAIHTPIIPPYSNSTIATSATPYDSTSTTTLSVYTTVYVQPSAV